MPVSTATQQPSLSSEPPLAPLHVPLTISPFIIGRARDAGARVDHPLVEPRHAVLVEREDGWWLTAMRPQMLVNGEPVFTGSRRLVSGDRIQLAGGAVLRFDDGQVVEDPATLAKAGWTPLQGRRRRRWRRNWRMPEWRVRTIVIALLLIAGLGIAGGFAWRASHKPPAQTAAAQDLTLAEAAILDSLLSVAFDHIERGNVLLEVKANGAALDEFAAGIATITTSSLRNKPYVQQRAAELRASVTAVYQAAKLNVPTGLANSSGAVAIRGVGLKEAMSVVQFTSAVEAIRGEFARKFDTALEITGRDHAEHLSLYGPGGAVDARTKTLSRPQVQFVVTAAQRSGIRVKDFSQDAVLSAQISAATQAGHADRAGTGLHLHLDRFANRNDRWTVPAASNTKLPQ